MARMGESSFSISARKWASAASRLGCRARASSSENSGKPRLRFIQPFSPFLCLKGKGAGPLGATAITQDDLYLGWIERRMPTVVDIGTLIERSPEIRKGRPCIAGTGVTVRRIAGWHNLGLTPEEIAAKIEHLTLAQIHAALAYYHANRDEIDSDIATEEAAIEEIFPTPAN